MNNVASNLKHQRKRGMLHIFVLLAKLLICCNLIADTAGTTHATTNATTAAVTSMLATASQHNMPHNWLRRQRRYLLFEKGSTLGVQTAVTKAFLPEHPRGLYQIYEYTANYELPTSLTDLWPKPTKAQTTMTKAKQAATTKYSTTTSSAAVHMANLKTFSGSNSKSNYNNISNDEIWSPTWRATADWTAAAETMPTGWQVPGQQRQWFSAHQKQQQHGKQYSARQQHRFASPLQQAKSFTFRPPILPRKFAAQPASQQLSVCPRRNVYGSWPQHVPRLCAAGTKTSGRDRKRKSVGYGGKKNNDDADHRIDELADEFHFATNAESIFFDLLAQWARIYNYPPHYCIMRTFCEARYLLAARGQSLFHDLLRILIDAALPAARRHAAYKKAISHDNLSDCAQHYATLCGLSFLQHFNEVVHGRFMQ